MTISLSGCCAYLTAATTGVARRQISASPVRPFANRFCIQSLLIVFFMLASFFVSCWLKWGLFPAVFSALGFQKLFEHRYKFERNFFLGNVALSTGFNSAVPVLVGFLRMDQHGGRESGSPVCIWRAASTPLSSGRSMSRITAYGLRARLSLTAYL